MDDEMKTRLRTITFSEERKGFDKGEVRQFLTEVSDWIEGGGGDLVRRRLERIAHKSANMLADAEDGAETLRREAEQEARALLEATRTDADAYRSNAETEAREQLREARADATSTREAANQYAADTSQKADEYAEQTRLDAKNESDKLREDAARASKQTVRSAEQRAEQIIAEANRQREDIETVIGDLIEKRDGVVAQVRALAGELEGTAKGVESNGAVERPPARAPEQVEAPELEAGDEEESVEELRADQGVVRHINGSGAI